MYRQQYGECAYWLVEFKGYGYGKFGALSLDKETPYLFVMSERQLQNHSPLLEKWHWDTFPPDSCWDKSKRNIFHEEDDELNLK